MLESVPPWVIRVPIETENQLINQMMAFLEGGSLDEALALLESVPADSLIVGMCRIFGDLYWIFGNNNKAKSSFKFGLALGPREPSLSVRIARFEARSGDSDSAMYTPRR